MGLRDRLRRLLDAEARVAPLEPPSFGGSFDRSVFPGPGSIDGMLRADRRFGDETVREFEEEQERDEGAGRPS